MKDNCLNQSLAQILRKLAEIDELCLTARFQIYNLQNLIWKEELKKLSKGVFDGLDIC